jgi:hypothetical protein
MPSDANAMTTKGNVVLYLDKELVAKSKELDFNLSKTFENTLKQLTTQFSTGNSQNNGDLMNNKCLWWAGPDSDRRPSARQADVLTRLDDRPTFAFAVTSFRWPTYLWVLRGALPAFNPKLVIFCGSQFTT